MLEQTPKVQGTIFSYDHETGYVVSMVGGEDYDRSEFNRVSQACRQPGSVYKPMYYSLALDRGYGFASLLNDVPRAEVDPMTGEVWTPTNLNNTVEYQVTLEYALIWSKNVPSVQLFKLVGGKEVEKLGAAARHHDADHPRPGAGAGRVVHAHRRADPGVLGVREERRHRRSGLHSPHPRPQRRRHRGPQRARRSVRDAVERLDRLVALAGTQAEPVIAPRTA